jgi:hypothetical protein
LLHEPGEVVELRVIGAAGARSFIHTDPEQLMRQALELNADGYNCYHTINPISPAFDVPSASDQHIARIRWIPNDLDPVRRGPDGAPLKECASTDSEKDAALEIAQRLVAFWRTLGVEPMLVDHGNGYCAYVPADLAVEDKSLVEQIIKAHARIYDTLNAHIDPSVTNPSRIMRIPGTVNRKGTATKERPHRTAGILIAGNRDQVIRAEDLRKLLPPEPPAKPKPAPKKGLIMGAGVGPEWVEDFLDHSEVEHGDRKTYGKGFKWVLKTVLDQDY